MTTTTSMKKTGEIKALFHSRLNKAATRKQQLEAEYTIIKIIQQAKVIPPELAQSLICSILNKISGGITDIMPFTPGSTLNKHTKQMEDLEYRLEKQRLTSEEIWSTAEWKAIDAALDTEIGRIQAEVLRSYGEFELAEMLERDCKKYEQLLDAEEKYFVDSEPE